MNDCEEIIRPALSSLVDTFEIRPDETGCEVLTPFQHRNGDLISVWVQRQTDEWFTVRDYGETFAMLRLYGVNPHSDSREKRVEYIADQFELQDHLGEIKLRASGDELGKRLLDAVQAIQAVSYLTYTHRTQQPSQFQTEVEGFLADAGYDFEPDFTAEGATHARSFDFSINHRDPSVLLDTIHTSTEYNLRQQVDGVMLNWYEIQAGDFNHGAVVDDVDGIFEESILDRLIDNLDYFFRWSEKEEIPQKIPITAK